MIHAFIFRVKHSIVLELFNPENEDAAIFRNTGKYLAVGAALHCRTLGYSSAPLW
jgi:hypothetical protein